MKKILLLSSLLITTLFSRENPFFSLSEGADLPVSSEINDHKPALTSMTYNFPNNSRLLKDVSFTLQNLDGSFETRKLEIDQSIDWRSPLILSQSNSRIHPSTTEGKTSSSNISFMQFIGSGNRMSIIAKEPMLRHFTLCDPDSIVVDFKHNGVFELYQKELSSLPYTKVKVTNHGSFARVILTLDGPHICNVSKTDQGASVICK
ncbi:MAG: hypothetical protein NT103_02330 [Campylobacterales bacterium]|nr:hypothetical protein [Campylobacterales bacterium]